LNSGVVVDRTLADTLAEFPLTRLRVGPAIQRHYEGHSNLRRQRKQEQLTLSLFCMQSGVSAISL
jgi:hypothetical protein